MALTQNQSDVNALYNKYFGRDGDFTSGVGASYWSDKVGTAGHSLKEIENALKESSEGKAYAASVAAGTPTVRPGGVKTGAGNSIYSQNDGTNTFLESIKGKGYNAADELNKISANTGGAGGFFQVSDDELSNFVNNNDLVTTMPIGDDTKPQDGWWNQFEDADAFKDFLKGDSSDNGMGDFMKFMMLMSVMGGGRGGGMMGGGSQYGYGGLNPGGVMQAYDPMAQLTKMGTWFKDTWGSGSDLTMGPTHNDPAPQI